MKKQDLMKELVFECIAQHKGGEKFFDSLDEKVKSNQDIMLQLISTASKLPNIQEFVSKAPVKIIVSGKFGEAFKQYIVSFDSNLIDKIICVEGGLRFNEIKNPQDYSILKNCYWIFIDDSYFAGRTANKVKNLVEQNNGVFLQTVVAYDGSEILQSDVTSLFRYYDHFGKEK